MIGLYPSRHRESSEQLACKTTTAFYERNLTNSCGISYCPQQPGYTRDIRLYGRRCRSRPYRIPPDGQRRGTLLAWIDGGCSTR